MRFLPGRFELVNEANPDRVGGLHKNNWDRLGRGLGCKRTLCALQYNNHGYLTANLFGGRIRQPPCCSVIRSPASLVAGARRKRPRCRRAAEEVDELAPLHGP